MKKILTILALLPFLATAQNVGIGTITPAEKLEVKNPLRSTLKISSNNTLDTAELKLSNGIGTFFTDFSIKSVRENGLFFSSQSDLPANNSANSLVIRPQGNVGVNDPLPTARLTVRGGDLTPDGQNAAIKLQNSLSANAWYLRAGAAGTNTPNGGFSIADNVGYHFIVASGGSVGVGILSPATSAKLDVSSTTQGFLPPRMTAAQRNAINSPAKGLVIYCTDCGGGELEVYNDFGWTNMLGNGPAGLISIGDNLAGGVVAYILQPGDPGYIAGQVHGLIAAPSDHQVNSSWGCEGTLIGGLLAPLGSGNANTIAIVAGCVTPGIAAKVCADLVLNGYSDWYLPSGDELNKLYLNRVAIGGFSSSYYWSSNEVNADYAFVQLFSTGVQDLAFKNGFVRFRAVRSF